VIHPQSGTDVAQLSGTPRVTRVLQLNADLVGVGEVDLRHGLVPYPYIRMEAPRSQDLHDPVDIEVVDPEAGASDPGLAGILASDSEELCIIPRRQVFPDTLVAQNRHPEQFLVERDAEFNVRNKAGYMVQGCDPDQRLDGLVGSRKQEPQCKPSPGLDDISL